MDNTLSEICKRTKTVKYDIEKLTTEQKDKALLRAAQLLLQRKNEIITANGTDLENGRKKGMHEGLLDRLLLNEKRIEAMAEGLRQVADLPDPIGIISEERTVPSGLSLKKISVPMGVIGIIYESRPNVTADAFSLCF